MAERNTNPRPLRSLGGALRHRDFRLLWIGGSMDNIGRWMDAVVMGLLVLELTDSAWQVALLFVMRWLPMLVFAMVSGIIADRVNRWLVIMVVRVGSVVATSIVLGLVASGYVQPWHLLLASLALGWLYVLEFPSRRSLIYDIVGLRLISNAMSLETISFTIGRFIGPLSAGVLIETSGFTGAYIGLLVGYILAFVSIGLVKSRIPVQASRSVSVLKNLASGVNYSLGNPVIRAVLMITLIMNALAFSVEALFPVVARDHLHVGAGLTGVLISAQAIGSFVAALIIASIRDLRFHGRIFVAGISIQLISLFLFALSPWYGVSFMLLLLMGFGSAGFSTMQSTIILIASSQAMRGSTLGVLGQCIGVAALGGLAVGAVADFFSAQIAVGISALLGITLLIPVLIITPLAWRPVASPETDNTADPGVNGLGETQSTE
ncbi:MAG TPA: MFS transporter [Dehalococcoidia bacterium]|nr:MFS transporter [Dehalococcoidia bacterium]